MLERLGVFVRRIDGELALGAHQPVLRHFGRAEAAGERGEALVGKAQHRAHRFLDFARAARGHRAHLDRLVAEQPARGVDAVDADVVERAAALGARVRAHVVVGDLEAENAVEQPRLAELAVQAVEIRCQALEHVALGHVVADLDGAGEAQSVGPPVTLDGYAVEAQERPAVEAPRVHAVLEGAQPALCQEGAQPLGKNDLWIAATAHVTGATLLTTDKDFDHLAGQFLKREWVDPLAEKKQSNP